MIKRCFVLGIYDWLLLWVDFLLVGLYYYCVRKFDKVFEIWKEIKECLVYKLECIDKLEVLLIDY